MKKLATTQSSQSGKSSLFTIIQSGFPDLAIIDQHINDDLVHPHIPIADLQRVAKETCGIPPTEVTKELLQAKGGPRQGQEASSSGNNLQMVLYGAQSYFA
jgi:hypothetical protein